MTPELDAAARERILDFVRPLSVGIDGVTNFGFVERRLRITKNLLEGMRLHGGAAEVDDDRLFLITAFAGLPAARRISPDSREDLLLRSLRIPFKEIRLLVSSLNRYEAHPQSLEEELVHDAMLLESVGAYGVTQILVVGARERMTLAEMAGEIETRMNAASFRTPAAQRLAEGRIELAKTFAKRLAEEVAEFDDRVGEAERLPNTSRRTP